MAVLALAVCTRAGAVVASRQYGSAGRERVESLLRLLPRAQPEPPGATPTFVEIDGEARLVYAALDTPQGTAGTYVIVLVTSMASNIVQDIATLSAAARVSADLLAGTIAHATLPRGPSAAASASAAATMAVSAAAAAVGASATPPPSGSAVWAAAVSASQGALSAVAGSPLAQAIASGGSTSGSPIVGSSSGDIVRDRALELVLAWDELLDAHGRRSDVSASQLGALLAMDSKDEAAAESASRRKQHEAAEAAKRKLRQIDLERKEAAARAARSSAYPGAAAFGDAGVTTATTYGTASSPDFGALDAAASAYASAGAPGGSYYAYGDEAVHDSAHGTSVRAAKGIKLGRRAHM